MKIKLKKKIRERTLSMNQSSENQIKIGHYILGETLGTGSFGKVKSMKDFLFNFFLKNLY